MTTTKNGCFNRAPFLGTLKVPDGYTEKVDHFESEVVRIQKMTEIPFVMSRDCQHDRKTTDPRCEGCCWQ